MKNSNTPRRKRYTKEQRLESSKEWIGNYDGKNIVKGYAKWYGVDLLCAIKELRMNAVNVDEDYENEVIKSIEAKKLAKNLNEVNRKKRLIDNQYKFSENRFAFIAGYTSGGAAYGITNEQMKDFQDIDDNEEIGFKEKK